MDAMTSARQLIVRVAWSVACALFVCSVARAQDHAQRANEALKAGNPELAIPEFEAIVRAHPENVDAQANLGVLLYFQKSFAPAADHLRAALGAQPDLGKIRGLLGLSELALGQRDAAANDLRTALPQLEDPVFMRQVGLTLVEVESSAGERAAAVATAQLLQTRQPNNTEVLYAAYRTATDLAGEALLSLSLAAPQSGQMQQAIAHELLRVRDIPAAIASLRRAVATDPKLPGIHFELAEALRASPASADRAEAEHEYRLALERNQQDLQATVRLADLLSERSSWQEARKLYETALSANPTSADAAEGLARVESETGNDAAAAILLERAVSADPTDMLAHFRLAAVYRKEHRQDDARRELAEYTRLKQVKEKLQQVYSTMKLTAPGAVNDSGVPSGASH
jgi:Tfp pilus assembly protein PilF